MNFTSEVVQDFFHQQNLQPFFWGGKMATPRFNVPLGSLVIRKLPKPAQDGTALGGVCCGILDHILSKIELVHFQKLMRKHIV